jgi:multisubunit Na+/H+ antiporter MnhC subunit
MTIDLAAVAFVGALALIGIAFYGLMALRNLIKLIVALQLLVKGILLAIILAGYDQDKMSLSQSMALTVIVADTIVAVIGLSLAVQIRRHSGTLDIKALTRLKR